MAQLSEGEGGRWKREEAMTERISICLPDHKTGLIQHRGDDRFQGDLRRYFFSAENNAAEALIKLKIRLRAASTFDFWSILMEGMTEIAGAQYGFVAKRILVDDVDSAVEMPPLGEEGSCLMGLAFYYNDGADLREMFRDYKYVAYGAPCAHMRHDKVFLIPDRLNDFVPNNVNKFPFPAEAYLAVPLFAEGKCFAHFGLMWTAAALRERQLSWGYLEMFLHSLEDLILQRILDGCTLTKSTEAEAEVGPKNVIPKEAVTAAQSLKPYARSLSHEFRTPMQGVVGMLDVMHATVQEVVDGELNLDQKQVFQTLRDNIEIVQDSSRRAVEAADNVVQAYDLNMEVPNTPTFPIDDSKESAEARKGSYLLSGTRWGNVTKIGSVPTGHKRRRSTSSDAGTPSKHRVIEESSLSEEAPMGRRSVSPRAAFDASEGILPMTPGTADDRFQIPEFDMAGTPGLRHVQLRELIRYIIDESLRVGGRPESATPLDVAVGESLEVRWRNSQGEAKSVIIEWSIDEAVPDTVLVDQRDLAKLISCVFLNALKFTEQGKIKLTASRCARSRFIVINILDTGPGIPEDFQPLLFKPFTQKDESLTRRKDGLGLGLLVAKGLVRKIGGDLTCVRSETSGPKHGSEFEICIPITPLDGRNTSIPGTPTSAPAPMSVPVINLEGMFGGRRKSDEGSSAGSSSTPSGERTATRARRKAEKVDRNLATKLPLKILVAEDNKINRKLLVTMLSKMGYKEVQEAYDGLDAVRKMSAAGGPAIDLVLMDLWMPNMDGYEATEKILGFYRGVAAGQEGGGPSRPPKILAVTADVTSSALERARTAGMQGLLTKPYKLVDLQRLILEHCGRGEGR